MFLCDVRVCCSLAVYAYTLCKSLSLSIYFCVLCCRMCSLCMFSLMVCVVTHLCVCMCVCVFFSDQRRLSKSIGNLLEEDEEETVALRTAVCICALFLFECVCV